MSVPVLDDWFSHSIRRNRKSFFLAMLSVLGVMLGTFLVAQFFSKTSSGGMVILVFWAPAIVCTYLLTAQRLRDFNVTGWLALLWIPIGAANNSLGDLPTLAALILLCAIPGTKGSNRYGPDPLASDLETVFD